MESRIPIYNRINLIVDKKELEYMLKVIENNMEKLDENIIQNLYNKLVNLNK